MSQIHERENIFPFLTVKNSLESHTTTYSTVTRGSVHRRKAVSAERDHARHIVDFEYACTLPSLLFSSSRRLVKLVAELIFLFLLRT
jgi:hypothetical protein